MKKKIAFISEHASPLAALGGVDCGGQNVYVGQLAKQLAAMGYEVDVFTRWDDGRLPQVIDWARGVRVVHIKAGPVQFVHKEELLPYMGKFTAGMRSFIKQHGLDYKIIHANFWMSGLVAANLKQALGIPYVVTFHALGRVRRQHQGTSDGFPDVRPHIEERVIREADQVIAECPQDKNDLVSLYGADPAAITMIPCGFDPHQFYPIDKLLARMLLRFDPHERLILHLGRLVPRKGADTIVQALANLKKRQIKARLVIVGGESDEPNPAVTPEIGRLQALARRLGVARQVTFAGRKARDKLKFYYSAADVFVTTPWYEPFGITPLEAMACGTPVIGSNVGGIKYSVIDGKTGFLVPPNNPAVLASKLKDLLQSQKLHNYFSEKALERVSGALTWAKVAGPVAALYEKILLLEQTPFERYEQQAASIDRVFRDASQTMKATREALRIPLMHAAQTVSLSLASNRKILVCGNGGSASQSQHLAAELVGRFGDYDRPALPVIALSSDTAIMTAWANDFSYEDVFARQVEAYGQPGDVLIGLTTSGNSANVLKAFAVARQKQLTCIALLGKDGGQARDLADIAMVVPASDTGRIQEAHLSLIHALCLLVEQNLFVSAVRPATALTQVEGEV
ncbi:MAG TPA: glycosyltransferase [Candidatus Saccharimonadales bacterium]|nr:glycosyltransferase [Candidatus Saccharimonadales bacterium]